MPAGLGLSSPATVSNSNFVVTGGTDADVTHNSVEYKTHTLEADGEFVVWSGWKRADVLTIAGGGSAGQSLNGWATGGGGGAGGWLVNGAESATSDNKILVSPGRYPVTVGAGGVPHQSGGNTSAFGITVTGGGRGGGYATSGASSGGSGGGADGGSYGIGVGVAGPPRQGYNGGGNQGGATGGEGGAASGNGGGFGSVTAGKFFLGVEYSRNRSSVRGGGGAIIYSYKGSGYVNGAPGGNGVVQMAYEK